MRPKIPVWWRHETTPAATYRDHRSRPRRRGCRHYAERLEDQMKPLHALAPAARRYLAIRDASLALAAPLSAEDCALQSMPEASPVKWHLAHSTWFFETFILEGRPGY